MRSIWLATAAALALTSALGGCSNTITVFGRAPATGESFAGLYDPGPFGPETIGLTGSPVRFTSSSGPQCEGKPSGDGAHGGMTLAITCDDGRTGTLTFDGPAPAQGTGTIGKDQVTMTLAAWRRG
jgi:hypothetical protein